MSSVELFEGCTCWSHRRPRGGRARRVAHAYRCRSCGGRTPTGDSWARGAGRPATRVLIGDPVAGARAILGAAPPPTRSPTERTSGAARRPSCCSPTAAPKRRSSVAELMGRTARHVLHPDWKPWQSLKARALAQLGRRDEAIAAHEAELELARGGRRAARRSAAACASSASSRATPEAHLSEAVELLSRPRRRGSSTLARSPPSAAAAAPRPPRHRGARAAAPGARARRGLRLPAARRGACARSSTRPARGRAPPRSPASTR